ncbi:DNA-binding SARP family transcriptional activator [Streptosporangium becharense]|uniref:DNA-binding SARP family transcriptional activator n=1 Tax=Streptosporangium becharense TaxID=1816182 RepID=A0A7W9MJU0_9ACTN|nr:BTAD domain-containing putative transcriptional regulator [Streptosporangium becharense]MBB2914575.1 DNA-binding SARP family transcriptional activator [Streptosporangium becharense]MBB5823420.1 DNA-binding SARP family transcriptional activator [Streptosporangium becharense]
MDSALAFRVLGPLDVLVDGRRVSIGGSRQRIILATLILRAGRVVPVEMLAGAVWGERPPTTARNQVVICVSGLRRAFQEAGVPPDVLGTSPPGYVLNAGPSQIDTLLAERLAAEARAAEGAGDLDTAARLFTEACGLWRGPALAGIESAFVEAEARRLDERQLTFTEERVEIELALGRHRDLIDDLAALVDANPLRERLRVQLMLARYRCGRRAEALDTYRVGRKHLVEELGIEPGTELQSLHDAILRDDPGLRPAPAPIRLVQAPAQTPGRGSGPEAAPAGAASTGESRPEPGVVPAQLPADVPHFVGRAAELAELDALLDERLGQGLLTVAVITGVGGVGKSGLAVHWAHRVAHRFPDGQLFVDLRGYDLNARPLAPGAVMDRFLRAFGVAGERIPEDLDERAGLLRTVIGQRRLLVVLDNARFIDQVRPLLPGSGTCCVIVTSRDPLGDLAAREGASVIPLEVLGSADSTALLAGVADERIMGDDPEAAALLGELCDGLPLALRIVGARLTARSYWTPARLARRLADERRRLDELSYGQLTVRASFALSYRDLIPEAALMFRRLGLLEAPDFAAWAGAALLDIDDFEAEDLIDQLVDAQLLQVAGRDGADQVRYRFHDLVRLYARERAHAEESAGERLDAVTRALSCWLALAEEAHQREYGGAFTQLHGTVPRWRPVAVDGFLERPLDWLDAERGALVAAVAHAARLGASELCWDLAVTATTLFEARSYFDDWRTSHETALAAARSAGDLRGEAAVLCSMSSMHLFQQVPERAGECLREARERFERLGDRYGLALTLRNTSLLDRLAGRFEAALDGFAAAKEIFVEVGDRFAEAHVLGGIAQVHVDRGRIGLAEPLLRQALEVFRRLGSERGQAQILNRLAEALLRLDRPREAEEACRAALALVRERKDGIGQAYILCGLGEIQLRQDLLDDAVLSLQEALGVARGVRERFVEARIHLAFGRLHARCGRLDEAVTHLEESCRISAELDTPLWRLRALAELGEVLLLRGDEPAATDVLKNAINCAVDSDSDDYRRVSERLANLSEHH